MKNIFLSIGIFFFVSVHAQSFDRGAMVADAQFNVGVYSTLSHDKIQNTDNDDGAVSKIFNGSFEYGILPWLGVGTKLQRDNFFVDPDTTNTNPLTIVQPTLKMNEISAMCNIHFVRKDHVDLLIGSDFGVSFLRGRENDATNLQYNGTGTWVDLHFTSRFYFGNHFGINFNIAYANFNFKNVFASDNTTSSVNLISYKGSGVNAGLGLQYRFGK